MGQNLNHRKKSRSRRRKESLGHKVVRIVFLCLFILVLIAVLGGVGMLGYRLREESRVSHSPLETSRVVVPETMGELN